MYIEYEIDLEARQDTLFPANFRRWISTNLGRVLVRSAKFGLGRSAGRGWYMFPGPTATPRCHFNDNSPLMKDHPCSFLPLNAPLSLPLSLKIFQSAAFLCLDVLSDSHVPKQLVSSKRDDDDAVLFTVLGLCFFPLFLFLLRIGQRI